MSKTERFPEWEKMTVREIRAYLEKRTSVILPIGVIEQHGYHLPTCTDVLNARETAVRVGKQLGMLVAPTINMSFSGGQLPGTINISPNVMGLLVGDVLCSLAAQGFKNIFIVLGHGGSENKRALDNTLNLLLRDNPAFKDVMLVLAPVWEFGAAWDDGFAGHDWHAGWVETSLVMAVAPELVQMEHLQTDAPDILANMREHPDNYQYAQKPIDHRLVVPRMQQRPEIEVGVMGAPEEATPEKGRHMLNELVRECAALFAELEKNRSAEYKTVAWTPEPIILGKTQPKD